MLGEITLNMRTLAVAGTHGKTTTSAMLAHILHASGHGCNAFLGGIAANYDSNVILNAASNTAVVEADEFDRSFLRLSPDIAIVNNTDPDHLDIYHRHEDVRAAFEEFTRKIKPGGLLIARHDLNLSAPRMLTFGIGHGDISAENIRVEEGRYRFDIQRKGQFIGSFRLSLPGEHNLLNATAAITAALEEGLSAPAIAAALDEFKGVKRRWEILFRSPKVVYADDYAHHPVEITVAIRAAREFFPGSPVTVFFQPHLFSRTRDFADGFAEALATADRCVLIPIYPARELPIEGVSSEMLMEKMPREKVTMARPDELPALAAAVEAGIILTLGAGDIDRQVDPILKQLIAKHSKS
jgi:UDP-N-acetylmuramate--alanine ligase